MQKLAETCERIAATSKKLEKTAIVAEYLRSQPLEDAVVSAVFLSGRPFPMWEETTLQVGGTFASLVAIWPSAGPWACLLWGDCAFLPNGSQILLWLASIAIIIGLILGLSAVVWLLCYRRSRGIYPAIRRE